MADHLHNRSEIIIQNPQSATNPVIDPMSQSQQMKRVHRASGVDLPIAEDGMEVDDELLLVEREATPLNVRPEIVRPPQSAALATAEKPCKINSPQNFQSGTDW